jgi:hypothetical protein
MLRSALTCTNGCSCWSPDEENSPGFFLTMDALYRLSKGGELLFLQLNADILAVDAGKGTHTSATR